MAFINSSVLTEGGEKNAVLPLGEKHKKILIPVGGWVGVQGLCESYSATLFTITPMTNTHISLSIY